MFSMVRKNGADFHNEDGWTFLETLIVIAVILILTATVGFMAVSNLSKARKAAAASQIDSFTLAVEAFFIDCGRYPTEDEGLAALRKKPETAPESWNGPYLFKNPPKDPWGNAYEYFVPGADGSPYGIRCLGADGSEGGENENADITSWE